MAKILVIEDDAPTAKTICSWLEREHHAVELALEGKSALDMLKSYAYDVIILDLMLPDMDGMSVLNAYRTGKGKSPVIVLTGRSALNDKIVGLDGGADDYIVKPVDMSELCARIRTVLRRPAALHEPVLQIGEMVIDPAAFSVKILDKPVQLTNREYAVLAFLARYANEYFTAEQLLDRVWQSDIEASPLTVRVCINRLRSKIDLPGRTSFIENSKGLGYRVRS
ncbi:MAG TPA: response regulator transcription factor [Candidatus Obscuribacterales bacterium]